MMDLAPLEDAPSQTTIKVSRFTDALIVVDFQSTFFSDGRLPVQGGEEVGEVIKEKIYPHFPQHRRYATRDRHPRGNVSWVTSYLGFKPGHLLTYDDVLTWRVAAGSISPYANFTLDELREYLSIVKEQILWNEHGDARMPESEIAEPLQDSDFVYVQDKATDPCTDAYSGLRENNGRRLRLGLRLKADGIKRVFLCGLAFDYCVGFTALDARSLGMEVFIIDDATRSVSPDSEAAMRKRLKAAGVKIIHSSDLALGKVEAVKHEEDGPIVYTQG